MPTPAIVPLEDITLQSSTGTINISNIPNTYRDIIISLTWQHSGTGSAVRIRFNDSTASHDWAAMYGNVNNSAGGWNGDETSSRMSGVNVGPTSNWSTNTTTVYDYSNANRHTLLISRNADPNGDTSYVGGRWESNAVVNKITLFDCCGQVINAGARLQIWGRI